MLTGAFRWYGQFTPAGVFGQKTLYKMLGYFSLVGLLRLHCLLGACPPVPPLPYHPRPRPRSNPDRESPNSLRLSAPKGHLRNEEENFTVCLSIPKQMLHDVNFQT